MIENRQPTPLVGLFGLRFAGIIRQFSCKGIESSNSVVRSKVVNGEMAWIQLC